MKGGPAQAPNGFTIVETMIVLAVTGILLGSALAIINGRQARTQWRIGVLQSQQQIEQFISEVQGGYFPNNGTVRCELAGGSAQPRLIAATGQAQGTNQDCIFLGKAFQLGTNDNASSVVAIPIAGIRKPISAELIGDTGVQPIAVAPGTTAQNSAIPDLVLTDNFSTLRIIDASYTSTTGGGGKTGAFAVLSTLSTATADDLTSTAQQYKLYASDGTAVASRTTDVVNKLDLPAGGDYVEAREIKICVEGVTLDKFAVITINDGLAVTLKQQDTTCK